MDNTILKFVERYNEHLGKENADVNITFKVISKLSNTSTYMYGGYRETYFNLDDEDLKYLFDKYAPKLAKEMQNNIEKVKEQYGISHAE